MTHALTCRELSEFLADYLDGALASERRALFEEHLAECPECHAYLRSYAGTMRLMKDAYEVERAPAGIPERLVRAILAARGT
jgi:predicted anti-sigma-YlaC factor YlaD